MKKTDRNEKGQFYPGMKGAHTTHGMGGTRIYRIYTNMCNRCTNPKARNHKLYYDKGIRVLWKSFEEFYADMYKPYLAHAKEHGEKNTSIDRIDNDGNYCKDNCRWATPLVQGRNTSQNRRLEFRGKCLTLGEWAEETGIQASIISHRLWKGWSIEKTLTKNGLKQFTSNGKTQSLADWARDSGINYQKLWDRVVHRKWDLERALTK